VAALEAVILRAGLGAPRAGLLLLQNLSHCECRECSNGEFFVVDNKSSVIETFFLSLQALACLLRVPR
jgi:hypothetical protein